jgi:hypothetical protein
MTTNRLATSSGAASDKCPPEMPRGDSPEQREARMRFWIERGNRKLDEAGKHRLEWRVTEGHYWLAERGAA